MIKVHVQSAAVVTRPSKKGGEFREQTGYVDLVDREGQQLRQKIVVPLQREQEPYAPGTYTLAQSSFYVGEYNKLAVYVRLAPLASK